MRRGAVARQRFERQPASERGRREKQGEDEPGDDERHVMPSRSRVGPDACAHAGAGGSSTASVAMRGRSLPIGPAGRRALLRGSDKLSWDGYPSGTPTNKGRWIFHIRQAGRGVADRRAPMRSSVPLPRLSRSLRRSLCSRQKACAQGVTTVLRETHAGSGRQSAAWGSGARSTRGARL